MREHTRREFLNHSAAAAGMLALGGQSLFARQAAAASKPADMTIARWAGKGQPAAAELKQIAIKLTEKAIEGLGGLKRFVSRGSVVWIKPNIGWDRTPEQAANTNPDVVAALVRLCFEAGAKTVKVGDNTCNRAQATYQKSGIAAAAKDAGAEVVFLDRSRFRETAIKGERIKSIPIYPAILDCDLLINVPIVKHHMLAKSHDVHEELHGRDRKSTSVSPGHSPPALADLTRFLKPQLCVLDAMRILTAHGPMGGNPATCS